MISFNDAMRAISEHGVEIGSILVPTEDALGRYVAENIYAPMDLPPFNNSAVDGFALRTEEAALKTLAIGNAIMAQGQELWTLPQKSCAPIMTGAPVPWSADTIIMKEDVVVHEGQARFLKMPALNDHIRFAGEDIKRDQCVARAGTCITPKLMALLLGLGLAAVKVFRSLRVAIIATGDELVKAPQPLRFGEVYYLVGPMLKAQCSELGLDVMSLDLVPDDQQAIENALKRVVDADIILLSGGMSKGERDLVLPALNRIGAQSIFYQGLWRPGKPLYFGHKDQARIFGLPGNPVAAFMCVRIFVQILISYSLKAPSLRAFSMASITHQVEKKADFSLFARAVVNDNHEIMLLEKQGSHHLSSLSEANALCHLEAGQAIVKANEAVKYYAI